MDNVVSVSGMFGEGHTFFAGSPVVITISGLAWPDSSPFTVVRVEVLYESLTVGQFVADTAGQTSVSFDISSALMAIWAEYNFTGEEGKAQDAMTANAGQAYTRAMREYELCIHTEYISKEGVFTSTTCEDSQGNTFIPGGRCVLGCFTEMERAAIGSIEHSDVAYLQGSNLRFGDASSKPLGTPERVGKDSITSWVDVGPSGTTSVFYPALAVPGEDSAEAHAPLVLRDDRPYTDFLFVNRRGAVETCSALMLEAMGIKVTTQQYNRVGRPSFVPSRSLMSIASGGRRSWAMSSGHLAREWAEWWALEFLMAKRWWMLYGGVYVPVIVEPANENTIIYDQAKQEMPSIEFTVTMALEG